ncbi:MAG TPA: VacJ family lipoprotein, partial [Rhodospirillales bacterium]|nr:VacJ family lipoprotein [Rhodospirillales bacterium]
MFFKPLGGSLNKSMCNHHYGPQIRSASMFFPVPAVSQGRRFVVAGITIAAFLAVISLNFSATAQETQKTQKTSNAAPTATGAKVDDPLEPINRVTSGFNRVVRGAIINPLVDGYKAITPKPVQKGVSNVISNLTEPITAGSSLLQGDTKNAAAATKRFIVNSTLGFAGIKDEASKMGIKNRKVDLGQAAGADGVASGPHIVIPILGPSNMRDATGAIITGIANPLGIISAVDSADS